MSTHLPVFRVLRRLILFIALLFSRHAFAQTPVPELTIRQGLPAANDFYEQFHYGHGTWLACVRQPAEFFTSKDGATWSRIPGPDLGDPGASGANAIQAPHYTYGAGRWVVATDSGRIFSSPDLVNWTASTTGTTATFEAVDYRDSTFYAVGDSATLFASPDGITWTRYNIPASSTQENFYQVTKGNGILVVSSFNATGQTFAYRSSHGPAGPWKQDTITNHSWIKFVNGLFYEYQPGGYASKNAHDWLPLTGTSAGYTDVFGDSSQVYIVMGNTIASSADSIDFNPPTGLPVYSVSGYYAHGHYFVWQQDAAGSTDAINYFTVGSYGPTAVSNGHTFVKVSPTPQQAYISSSTDFTHWIPRDTVATGLAQALYDSTQFMAQGPTVYTSPNGAHWSPAGTSPILYSNGDFHCIYGGGTYVAWWAMMPTNYVWYSHDGINWGGSTLPPPTEEEYYQGYTSAVNDITNIQYVNGRFWMLNSWFGGTPAAIYTSSNGENFDTLGFYNNWSNFNVFAYDQLLYVPDSNKYFIFGMGAPGSGTPVFFTSSTTNPMDSTLVLQNHTTLTGNLTNTYLYDGAGVSYGLTYFVDAGGYDFVYSNGHFVGSATGAGNPVDPNIPPSSYVLWSSDGSTWNGSPLQNYAKVLSNVAAGDTFRMEGWNNYEMIATFVDSVSRRDSILRFTASASSDNSSVSNNAVLTWQMTADSNIREFVIQRSANSSAWTTLDSVAGPWGGSGGGSLGGSVGGSVAAGGIWHYTDASPVAGNDDYRLTMEYTDSSSRLSPVRRVHIAEPEHIAIFPNPARDQVMLMADPAITAVVTVYTEDGRQVQTTLWNGSQTTLYLTGLPAGTYHLVIRRQDGTVYDRHVLHVN